jgi:hypothetical protein
MMEQAMVRAIEDCASEGVTDQVLVKQRMDQYRERARQTFKEVEARAAQLIAGLPLPTIEDIVGRAGSPLEKK